MAFTSRNLSAVAYVKGWTLWNYITEDSIEEVVADPEYFGNATAWMRTGDVFYIVANGITYQKYLVLQDGKTTLKNMGE